MYITEETHAMAAMRSREVYRGILSLVARLTLGYSSPVVLLFTLIHASIHLPTPHPCYCDAAGTESDNEVERILGFSAPAAPAGNSTATSSASSMTTTAAAIALTVTGVAIIFLWLKWNELVRYRDTTDLMTLTCLRRRLEVRVDVVK